MSTLIPCHSAVPPGSLEKTRFGPSPGKQAPESAVSITSVHLSFPCIETWPTGTFIAPCACSSLSRGGNAKHNLKISSFFFLRGNGHSLGCNTFSSLYSLYFTGLKYMMNIHYNFIIRTVWWHTLQGWKIFFLNISAYFFFFFKLWVYLIN